MSVASASAASPSGSSVAGLIVVNVPPPAPTSSPSINNSVTLVDADAVMNSLLDKCLFDSLWTVVAVPRLGKRRVSTATRGSSYSEFNRDISA